MEESVWMRACFLIPEEGKKDGRNVVDRWRDRERRTFCFATRYPVSFLLMTIVEGGNKMIR